MTREDFTAFVIGCAEEYRKVCGVPANEVRMSKFVWLEYGHLLDEEELERQGIVVWVEPIPVK